MIEALIKDNEAIARRLRDAIEEADAGGDVFTADFPDSASGPARDECLDAQGQYRLMTSQTEFPPEA